MFARLWRATGRSGVLPSSSIELLGLETQASNYIEENETNNPCPCSETACFQLFVEKRGPHVGESERRTLLRGLPYESCIWKSFYMHVGPKAARRLVVGQSAPSRPPLNALSRVVVVLVCTFLAGNQICKRWATGCGGSGGRPRACFPGMEGMVVRGLGPVWWVLGLRGVWVANRKTLRGSTKQQMRQVDTAFQVFRRGPLRGQPLCGADWRGCQGVDDPAWIR